MKNHGFLTVKTLYLELKKNRDAQIELKVVPSCSHMEIIDKTDVTNEDVADVFAIPLDRFESLYVKDSLSAFDAKNLADELVDSKISIMVWWAIKT